jgi:hypothetical protein
VRGEHHCVEHFSRWLRMGMTRCGFAASIAGAGKVAYLVQLDELTDADIPQLEAFVDGAGLTGNFAVILLPRIRTARGIVRLLEKLSASSRWTASRVAWRKHARAGAALVGLNYKTGLGEESSVMGFAPLGCMPVTRRAPYVALGIWAGGKVNTHKKTSGNKLGFIDGLVVDKEGFPLDAVGHEKMWDTTMDRVRELLGDPEEDDFRLKDLAFCLGEAAVVELFSDS